MTTHHCEKHSLDPYCNCYSETGEDLHFYKQFDTVNQTYNCCDRITSSLQQLSEIASGGSIQPGNAKNFFQNLSNTVKNGCCYKSYFGPTNSPAEEQKYFIKNHEQLYNNFMTVRVLYNQFIYDKPLPTMDTAGGNVVCDTDSSGSDTIPYILSYRSPGELYYNYSYICSSRNNSVFTNLYALSKTPVDYRITRFYDNATGQPCIKSSCQLVESGGQNNFGNISNQGNSQPIFHNNKKPINTGFLASGVIALLLFLVSIFVFYSIHKKMKILESNRER